MGRDENTNIAKLKAKVQEFVKEREWEKFHNPKNLAQSMAIESAELMELFQWRGEEEIEELMKDPEYKTRTAEELADVIIYSLSLANRTGIDVAEAVLNKIDSNAIKYPVEKSKGRIEKSNQGK